MVEKTQTNSNSVISITLGILSILIPMIGIILGVIWFVFARIALKEIRNTNDNGRGLATAGLICSVVGVVPQLFRVLGFALFFCFILIL
ncbi:DUF4190 domain-containing protein [Sporosarcina sp. Marseille-Q4063]|uniref:DUF4190 domain-containing protein n=1 Tax=Sporosarcina sp. Marseille-Q4063 TaxID=2810514 RepID=UPI001BAF97D3|nr:DUF4190 domain-containing protein [Sporosarcina sp. Marseille-Q4063]QUW22911.1 DUF4190 domain-containing protein [Sporosarcina sp. Marseille-Q4063]